MFESALTRNEDQAHAPKARRYAKGAEPEIVLDLSRLLSRIGFHAPTGVDRVEMAYARRLLEIAPERLSFAAVHPCGLYGRLPTAATAEFLDETLGIWRGDGERPSGPARTLRSARRLLDLAPSLRREPIPGRLRPRVYLQVSPHHLDQTERVRRILRRERARFVCLVHDLIPIEYPEHARPDGPGRHVRRMDTVVDLANGVIAASETTRRSLMAHAARHGRQTMIRVAPLGAEPVERPQVVPPRGAPAPYFVMVATIEPRKNHLLLLNLWRRMVEDAGPQATPKLVLVGRRGWENENIIDMLDRCPALKGVVEERGHVADEQMWPLIQGARALLMPSFAEGFGLPVVEALQLGAPVLCSDIPAHREIAGDVAEFLDPLDGPGWRRAILDYARAHSPRRADQLQRMAAWRAPTWEDHVDTALDLIDEVSQ